jgi:hypothetical protein
MNTVLQIIVISLKFIVPAGILWKPFQFVWANYLLDIIDGDILQEIGMSDYHYQTIDKSMDLVSYVFMLIAGSKWQIKRAIIALFSFRLIGQILFFLTRNELSFFYFQNFLEPLVMTYALLIFMKKSEAKAYLSYKKHFKLIWFIILTYKLWNEWYLHYANIDLSSLFLGFNGGE